MKLLGLIAGAALLLGAQSAYAVSITNGSFELGVDPGSFSAQSAGSTDITGWDVGPAGVDYIGTYWTASDGTRSIDMSNLNAGSLSQSLSGLTIGQQYTVTFDMAGNPDGGPIVKQMDVSAGGLTSTYIFDTTGKLTPAIIPDTRTSLPPKDGDCQRLTGDATDVTLNGHVIGGGWWVRASYTSRQSTPVTITAGEDTHELTLPSGYHNMFFKADGEFDAITFSNANPEARVCLRDLSLGDPAPAGDAS